MTKVYSEPYKVPGFSNSRLECRVRYTTLSLLVPTSANNWKLSLFNVLFLRLAFLSSLLIFQ